jgi:apolipoprotein N-acyltransferase
MSGATTVRYATAALGGLLWAAAFPNFNVAGLGWVAPGIILFAALGANGATVFRLGFAAGFVHHLVALYWLLFIPYPVGAVAGWLALSAFLSLYPATWAWLCWRCLPGRPAASGAGSWVEAATGFAATSLPQRIAWSLLCAIVWVALEMVRSRFLSGFPWNLLGASQYRMTPLIQLAAWTGVYGISFLMVWFAVAFGAVAVALVRPRSGSLWLSELFPPVLVVAGVYAWGYQAVLTTPKPTKKLRVALVQPSIKQELIFDPKENPARFRKLLELTRAALEEKPQVLIWPEAAMPSLDKAMFRQIVALIREHRVWMIFGADDAEPPAEPSGRFRFYNAAFLFRPDGTLAASYRKQRLVIFGEYVPLARWLPLLKRLTPIEGGFTPGTGPVPFRMPDLQATTSALICFEDNFPHAVRGHVDDETDFLLNLTNNGWFGESAAQWQHAANAVFRAIENRVPLVRCTNNGLTCWVDVNGGLHAVYFPDSENVYAAGHKLVEVPLRDDRPRMATFYHRHGDGFGWACCGMTLLFVLRGFVEVRRVGRRARPRAD